MAIFLKKNIAWVRWDLIHETTFFYLGEATKMWLSPAEPQYWSSLVNAWSWSYCLENWGRGDSGYGKLWFYFKEGEFYCPSACGNSPQFFKKTLCELGLHLFLCLKKFWDKGTIISHLCMSMTEHIFASPSHLLFWQLRKVYRHTSNHVMNKLSILELENSDRFLKICTGKMLQKSLFWHQTSEFEPTLCTTITDTRTSMAYFHFLLNTA